MNLNLATKPKKNLLSPTKENDLLAVRSVRSLFLPILFFVINYGIYCQDPITVALSEKDGLPDTEIYDLLEDRKGYIWLATSKGLYRYDGRTFTAYTNEEKKGLSVFNLREDDKGRIWSNNLGGQFFYIEDDQLITFTDLSSELNGRLGSYYVVGDNIWVFGRKGIYKIDAYSKTMEKITAPEMRIGPPFFDGKEVDFFSNKGYESLTLNTGIRKKWETGPISFFIPFGKRKTILARNGHHTLVNMEEPQRNVFFLLDERYGTKIEIPTPHRVRNTRIYNSQMILGKLWLATDGGVHTYRFQDEKLVYEVSYQKGEKVSKVMLDRDKNIWFATLNNGVHVIPNINVVSYSFNKAHQNISSIERINDSTLAYGTENGEMLLYNVFNQNTTIVPLQFRQKVSAIRYNPFKNLLYIAQDNASQTYHLGSKRIIQMKGPSFNNSKDIALVHPDTIMFASYYGTVVSGHAKGEDILDGRNVITEVRGSKCFYSERTKKSYVALVDGLARIEQKINIIRISNNGNPIYATSLTETQDGTLWVSTFKNGVFGIRGDSVHFHLSKKDRLISDKVSMVKGQGDSLWIVTERGIQIWNAVNGSMRTLSKKDGIPTYNIKGIEHFGNQTLMATSKGFFGILKGGSTETEPPKVYFDGVEVMDKDIIVQSRYNLPYNKNKLQFSFNTNGFKSQDNVQYSYRLLGENDTSWKKLDLGIHNVTFQSLSSGDYTFQLKANNLWDTDTHTLKEIYFSIGRPYWKQWWFYGILGGIIIIILYLYVKRLIQKREKEKNEQLRKAVMDNELISLKLENLRSQMNPHFIFNALNSIQEYIITNQKHEASEYLGKFADLMRRYLAFNETGNVSLSDEVESLRMYLKLEALRFEDDFQYQVSLSKELEHSSLEIPIMLVQPFVENAIVHGLMHKKGIKKLLISFTKGQKNNIICIIEDNGIGREKGLILRKKYRKDHRSFAEKATKERLDLFNHGTKGRAGVEIIDLYENDIPTGTKVILCLPIISKIVLKEDY
ncbi:MAG: hypothetical protein GYB37_13085 [Algicola sp.]|nr:hypothetical protein [Algicola sp.]